MDSNIKLGQDLLKSVTHVLASLVSFALLDDYNIDVDIFKAFVIFSAAYKAVERVDVSLLVTGIYFLLKSVVKTDGTQVVAVAHPQHGFGSPPMAGGGGSTADLKPLGGNYAK
eukprot:jgi/Mesvir1/15115/Mv14755-RA.1